MDNLNLALTSSDIVNLVYLLAAVLFIVGLKMLTKVSTAARGNLVSATGMLLAAVVTFFYIAGLGWYGLIGVIIAILLGTAIGLYLALKVEMTGMPEMVAIFNGFGGIASLLVASGDYMHNLADFFAWTETISASAAELTALRAEVMPWHAMLATGLASLIGGVTFTGSLVAYAKLKGGELAKYVPSHPVQFNGQKLLICAALGVALLMCLLMMLNPTSGIIPLILIVLIAFALGLLLVIGIGGADMPVVISLLNSYSGLAAAFAGFVLNNVALIITGSLVGASGIILTNIMCKAMNRSLMNVLFGGVGKTVASSAGGATTQGEAHESTAEDAAIVFDAASSIVIVPGYGMAVAQAQHVVKELADVLNNKGIAVRYAIHPVAGRMPGHMNVLLAEAGVEYDVLMDLEQSNNELSQADVALVIGANDVTNPAARHDESSPLYGMPILNVDDARTVFVIKRSMRPGFAGIENELYFHENTRMIFGDAKKVVTDLVNEVQQI